MRAELVQHGRGLFERCARRHIDHHLKLRLIVERQHFQLHQTQHGQNHRKRNQAEHPQAEFEARTHAFFFVLLVEQWAKYFVKNRTQLA